MSDPKRVVKLAKMYQETIDLAKEIDDIGNLKQARRNAEAGADKAREEMRIAIEEKGTEQSRLYTVKCDLKIAEKLGEETVALAKQVAQEIIDEAKEEAMNLHRAALKSEQIVADRIVEDQERHTDHMAIYASDEVVAQAAVAAIEKKLAEVRAQIGLK